MFSNGDFSQPLEISTVNNWNDFDSSLVTQMLVASSFVMDRHKERSMSADSGLLINHRPRYNCRLKPSSSVDNYLERTRQSSCYLRMLIHSVKCQGRCSQDHCLKTCIIVTHVKQCFNAACKFKGCHTSKKLLTHYKACSTSNQFCLMCSFVSVNNRPSSSPHTSSSKSTSTDSTHNSSPNPSVDDDAESCRTQSAVSIYDEMIDFSKVPFRELEVSEAFLHRNSCGSISGGSLSALMNMAYDDDEQRPLKIRSQSLDS